VNCLKAAQFATSFMPIGILSKACPTAKRIDQPPKVWRINCRLPAFYQVLNDLSGPPLGTERGQKLREDGKQKPGHTSRRSYCRLPSLAAIDEWSKILTTTSRN
jgi:hypothetical protein